MAQRYLVYNGAMPTTAPPSPVTTSASLYTLLQIVPAQPGKIIEWGVTFSNNTTIVGPLTCELVDTGTVAATVTAFAVADVMKWGGYSDTVTQTSGSSGVPLNLGTALSGYTSSSEGSTTACRVLDLQQVEPVGGYYKQFPLDREPFMVPGNVVRLRIRGDGTSKALAYVIFEI